MFNSIALAVRGSLAAATPAIAKNTHVVNNLGGPILWAAGVFTARNRAGKQPAASKYGGPNLFTVGMDPRIVLAHSVVSGLL